MKTLLASVICLASLLLNAAPANDNFANRIALVGSGSISTTGSNVGASKESGDPTTFGGGNGRTVWWKWTASFSGPASISTFGSSFDTVLGVYTGSSLASLATIASNDDFNGYTSKVTFNTISGTSYAIMVGGYNGSSGAIKLAVTVTSSCAYTISPASRSFAYIAGTGTVSVTTTTGCTWISVSNDSWITVTSGNSGSGNGSTAYSVAANTTLSSRTGSLTVAGLTHTVTQAAAPGCTYVISPTSASSTSDGGSNVFSMDAGVGCAWTTTPNVSWITIRLGASGTGDGTIDYLVAANTSSNTRTGTITSGGKTFTVTQDGVTPCTYSISPTSASYAASGGSGNITVSTMTACAWTASSQVAWITFSTTNGTGSASVSYTVAFNASTVARNTTLIVAGVAHTVSQAGATCTYALTPTSVSAAAGVSTGTVTVTAGTSCAWSAVANVTWLTITSGVSGSGNGSVGYSVAANPNTAIRAGTLTIGGQTFTVNQAAAACTYSIAPTAAHYSDVSGTGSITVTAGAGCAWTAVANDAFITINSGTPGSGNGTVGYTVAANVTTTSRTGTITVAGLTFTVTQDGTSPCNYGITPSSASYTSIGGSSSVAVTANAGCTWSASSAASWVTISTASGSGNGTVPYTVATNTSSISRNGTLTIAGNPFTITQTGVTCTYSIAPTTAAYTYVGGSGSVTITSAVGCAWNSSSDSAWLTVTSGSSGTGNGTLGYTVAATTSPASRTGRLTIAGRLLSVTQTGAPCTFTISPTSALFGTSGGTGSVTITASDSTCAWTTTSNASWLTATPTNGTGSSTLNYTVASTTVSRSGTITVATQTFTVTQNSTPDTTAPSVPTGLTATPISTSQVTLNWNASTDTGGAGLAGYRVYKNASLQATTANLTYTFSGLTAGQTNCFTVAAYDLASPPNVSAQSTQDCTTTLDTTNPTTTITAPAAGTVSGLVSVTATASDNVGVRLVEFYAGATLIGMDLTSPYAILWDTTAIANAAYALTSKAYDAADNVATSAAVNVTVSNPVPTPGQVLSAFSTGAANQDYGYAIARAADGSIYVGGSINSGPYLARFSPTFGLLWSVQFGPIGRVNAIALDTSSNVLITGYFQSSVNFGGGNLTTAGGNDIFVAKLSPAGVHQWSRRFGSTVNDTVSNEAGIGIAAGATNNVMIVGGFISTCNFGGTNLVSKGAEDIFVATLDSFGNHYWSKCFGSTALDIAKGVATDATGNSFVTGQFGGSIDFGAGTISAVGSRDILVARFSPSGTCAWSKRFGTVGINIGNAIALDASGDAALTGHFQNAVNFGGSTLTNAAYYAVFVAKLAGADGAHQWSRAFGGNGVNQGNGIAFSSTDSTMLATGAFVDIADFGGGNVASLGGYDVFVAKYATATGVFSWVKTIGGANPELGEAISADASGNPLATGYFSGSFTAGPNTLTSAGFNDIFIARFAK